MSDSERVNKPYIVFGYLEVPDVSLHFRTEKEAVEYMTAKDTYRPLLLFKLIGRTKLTSNSEFRRAVVPDESGGTPP